ncbi:hypothetical protein, conserved [Trypanosoma cruzi]|uniref:Arf-GAP domain-containing protein n=2 Tax=Trypanosoma cruzi TaxID=5693 RepID=Q4DXC4_TRYCC|nr:hypothetical protein, conserved [Trypanosoma cruzi]EAN97173.1 hypothetical protein, conserved [Trypanosoma cruzi]|eukprot:XP_819024.1 hypothetical protein [Trypanosoma cruzi strain CL Brener]
MFDACTLLNTCAYFASIASREGFSTRICTRMQPRAVPTGRKPMTQKLLLEKLLHLPENRECFECSAKQPRWASTNLGIFLCLRCAGIHRAMGTHVSKVRSTNMDTWEDPMIECCECIGNKRGRVLYEHGMDPQLRPTAATDNISVDRFIRDKYERKMYYNPQYETLLKQFFDAGTSVNEEKCSGLVLSKPSEQTGGTSASMPMLWGGSPATAMEAPASLEGNTNTKNGIDINELFTTTTSTVTSAPMQHQQQQIFWTQMAGNGMVGYHQYYQQQSQCPSSAPSQAGHQVDVKTEIMSLFSTPPNCSPNHVYSAWQPQ